MSAHPEEVWARTSFDTSVPWRVLSLPRRSSAELNLGDFDAEDGSRSIPAKKKKDLLALAAHLPAAARSFYEELEVAESSGSEEF